jgi:LysR family transcriptional regulator, glycine cleavage system transcriptional activator
MVAPTQRLPPLAFLRTFEAVARHRSFTLAAKELFLTPSAVSHQIRQVEETLGAKLFQRLSRGIELTGAGRTLLRGVEGGLERISSGCEQVRAMQGPRTITVFGPPTVASFWLAPRLTEFGRRHPEIEIRLVSRDGGPDVEREKIDLALMRVRAEEFDDQSEDVPILRESVFPVCSPMLARPDCPLKVPADLLRHTLLHEEQFSSPELDWTVWLEHLGVRHNGQIRGPRFSHFGMAIAAALQGHGVALGRSPLNDQELGSGGLVRPFGDIQMPSSRIFVARFSRGGAEDPMLRRVLDFLRQGLPPPLEETGIEPEPAPRERVDATAK